MEAETSLGILAGHLRRRQEHGQSDAVSRLVVLDEVVILVLIDKDMSDDEAAAARQWVRAQAKEWDTATDKISNGIAIRST